MDPAMFRIDFAVVAEVLTTIIVLAFIVERALALIFEHRLYVNYVAKKGLKEPIAFLACFAIVWPFKFDALAILLHGDQSSLLGCAVTAAIIAGGSKASIKLFHDVMNAKSDALRKGPSKPQEATGQATSSSG